MAQPISQEQALITVPGPFPTCDHAHLCSNCLETLTVSSTSSASTVRSTRAVLVMSRVYERVMELRRRAAWGSTPSLCSTCGETLTLNSEATFSNLPVSGRTLGRAYECLGRQLEGYLRRQSGKVVIASLPLWFEEDRVVVSRLPKPRRCDCSLIEIEVCVRFAHLICSKYAQRAFSQRLHWSYLTSPSSR